MREIKFRAWHTGGKYPQEAQMIYDKPHHVFKWLDEGQPVTIMQFTGLKDKNGVEIYEGDIIRYVSKSDIKTHTKEVVFKYGAFVMEEDEYCDIDVGGVCSDEFHEGSHVGFVIGNIYENPELLESK